MSTSEFDKQLQEQYDRGGFDYNPASWQDMRQQLDAVQPAKSSKALIWLPYTGMAASLALVAVLSYFFYVHRQHTAPAVTVVQPATHISTPPATVALPEAAAQQPAVVQKEAAASARRYVPQHTVNAPAYTPAPEPQQAPPAANTQEEEAPVIATAQIPPVKKAPADITAYVPDEMLVPHKEKEAKASLNLAGGFNYGTLNTGYAFAVNARRSISDKFYVEGDLAFINNNPQNTSNVTSSEYKALTSGAFTPGGVDEHAANSGSAVNTLSYLQFTPTVGYHIRKKLTVGMGADLQRMLQNGGDKTIVYENGEAKIIPGVDFGVVAKTEYSITPRLKTGIMYREGLNALADPKYLNRRYIQMQLKLRLFEK